MIKPRNLAPMLAILANEDAVCLATRLASSEKHRKQKLLLKYIRLRYTPHTVEDNTREVINLSQLVRVLLTCEYAANIEHNRMPPGLYTVISVAPDIGLLLEVVEVLESYLCIIGEVFDFC